MTQKYSFSECYKILDISPDSQWSDLRKSYKHLIQKWHPDRFQSGSEKQSLANTKITNINLAYRELSKYYRLNKCLPPIDENKQTVESRPTDNTDISGRDSTINSTHVYSPSADKAAQPKTDQSHRGRFLFALIVTGLLLYYLSYHISDEQQKPDGWQEKEQDVPVQLLGNIEKNPNRPPELSGQMRKDNSSSTELTSKKTNISSQDEDNDYFTFGSTIGEIISVQGPPDKIENDIWYYGESEVYFKDGAVIYWKRSPGSVLKARIGSVDSNKVKK